MRLVVALLCCMMGVSAFVGDAAACPRKGFGCTTPTPKPAPASPAPTPPHIDFPGGTGGSVSPSGSPGAAQADSAIRIDPNDVKRQSSGLQPDSLRLSASDFPNVGNTISPQAQDRHIINSKLYVRGGYLNSRKDAQRILDDFHSGKSMIIGRHSGGPIVRNESVVGFDMNQRRERLHSPTNNFWIKGETKVSIVPFNPDYHRVKR